MAGGEGRARSDHRCWWIHYICTKRSSGPQRSKGTKYLSLSTPTVSQTSKKKKRWSCWGLVGHSKFYTLFYFLNKTIGWPRVPRTNWTHGESHSLATTIQLFIKRGLVFVCPLCVLIVTESTCVYFRAQLDQLDIKENMASQDGQWVSVNHNTQH